MQPEQIKSNAKARRILERWERAADGELVKVPTTGEDVTFKD